MYVLCDAIEQLLQQQQQQQKDKSISVQWILQLTCCQIATTKGSHTEINQ